MPKYLVMANNLELGIYIASSQNHAKNLCAIDAGYQCENHMIDMLETPSDLLAIEIIDIKDNLCT